jgi:DNA-binding winged helix-turn-helix (wHTH) protein
MPSTPCLFFRGFCLDRTTETLWEGSQRLPVRPKAWALLQYLVENPHRLLPQAELLAAIWQREYVSDGLLRGAIRELRRLLHDEAATPRCIETVSGRGYRFIAEVTVLPSAPSLTETGDQDATDATGSTSAGSDAQLAVASDMVVRCPRCQTSTLATRLFCTTCGQALAWACPQCGARNDPTAHFCGGCGHAFTVPLPPTVHPGLQCRPSRPPVRCL